MMAGIVSLTRITDLGVRTFSFSMFEKNSASYLSAMSFHAMPVAFDLLMILSSMLVTPIALYTL